jgi:hypothetical protein
MNGAPVSLCQAECFDQIQSQYSPPAAITQDPSDHVPLLAFDPTIPVVNKLAVVC